MVRESLLSLEEDMVSFHHDGRRGTFRDLSTEHGKGIVVVPPNFRAIDCL
jgi:hypothetical protein